jgi:exopolysaccharide biosynthesis WecB/TagA/CpsF family protein
MIDRGKYNLLGVLVNAIDYEAAVERVIVAAKSRQSLTVSALAVHGVMTGVMDPEHRYRLNQLDLVVPDGQPVRWALNALYRVSLKDRVYGPTLTLKICERAARERLPVYFYGSRAEVLNLLCKNVQQQFPELIIAGCRPSFFRQLTEEEQLSVAANIKSSDAAIVFVGLGCPRQEVWIYEHRDILSVPTLAVGAAFDFHAGTLPQAPHLLQSYGLEWAFRLAKEPRRLWRRYMLLNPLYLILVLSQYLGLYHFDTSGLVPKPLRYG